MKLKELLPLVLVDMPGFDSPFEHHNKAIAEYIDKGIYYIVLSKVSDGTIHKSLLNYLEDIDNLGRKFSFFLSYTDVVSPTKVQEVKNQCNDILKDSFMNVPSVEAINNTSAESVFECLKTIKKDELFKGIYYSRIQKSAISVLEGLNHRIKSYDLDTENVKQAQQELEQSRKRIEETSEAEIQNMRNKYSGSMVNNIINDVSSDLDIALDEIVQAIIAKSNVESLLNETVRSSLISSLERRVGEANNSIVLDFSDSLENVTEIFRTLDIDKDYATKVIDMMQDIFKALPLPSDNPSIVDPMVHATGALGSAGISSTISTLMSGSVASTVSTATGVIAATINPILGLVTAFLPSIIKGLLSIFGQKASNDNVEAQIKSKIAGEVFPQIKSKLRLELPGILGEMLEKMIEQVQKQYKDMLASQEAEFTKAMQEKENSQKEIEEKKALLINLRGELQNTLQDITTWRLA